MTIKEIARLANVSPGTVDRVIHNRGSVNPEKRKVIEEIIERYDFRPNVFASNLKLNKTVTVGYLTPLLSTEDGYWNDVYKGVLRAVEDFDEHIFRLKTFEYDRTRAGSFSIQAERMISSGITAALIVAKNVEEAQTFFSVHSDLHYVLIDSAVPGANPMSVIGQNPERGGRLAARIMSMLAPGAARYLTFSFMGSQISRQRSDGFIDYFKDRKDLEIVNIQLDSVDEIMDYLSTSYSRNGDFDGIFSPCFAGHHFGNYLNAEENRVKIISYDLNKPNREALEKGRINCILSQKPASQGYSGVYQLYKSLILQQDIDSFIEILVDVYFSENLPKLSEGDGTSARSIPYVEDFWIY